MTTKYESFNMAKVLEADIKDTLKLTKTIKGFCPGHRQVIKTAMRLEALACGNKDSDLKDDAAINNPEVLELINLQIQSLKALRAYILTKKD